MNKYTSIELSRLIQSKVSEVRTEKWHQLAFGGTKHQHWEISAHMPDNTSIKSGDALRAYHLDEVLTCIKVWGEKQGLNRELRYLIEGYCKDDECNATEEVEVSEIVSEVEYHCHRLLTAYIEDGLQFGERCEGVIRSIFEV